MLYESMVLQMLEYSGIVLHDCGQENTNMIE